MDGKKISGIEYLPEQLRYMVDAYGGMKEYMLVSGAKKQTLRRIMLGKSCRLGTVERLAECLGMSVADMFIDPEVETEWYRDAKLEYLPENLKKISEESEMDLKTIAQQAQIIPQTYEWYLAGLQYPMTDRLQRIADVLDVEVAELFLPPEGSE